MGKNQSFLRIEDENFYKGEYVFTGKGVYTWPDGRKYKGDFVYGQRTGK